jgi:formate/nitrite transporter FocA (FNT family)
MSNTDKEQNKNNMAVDDVMKQISDFSEKLHAKNQKRIKNGIICIFVIPLIFLIVLFAADSSKVVYLLLWVISMFIIAAYLISVAYIDYTMQEKLEKLGLEIKNGDRALIGNDFETLIDAVKNKRPLFSSDEDEDYEDDED